MPDAAPYRELFVDGLDADERARLDQYKFDIDREKFLVRRGVLRSLLMTYSGTDAASIRYRSGKFGKPELRHDPGLKFSISFSGNWILIGLTQHRSIGVDLEALRHLPDRAALTNDVCTGAELALLSGLGEEKAPAIFYRIWTLKEALLKGIGTGLARDPATINVSAILMQQANRFCRDIDFGERSAWQAGSFCVGDHAVGAVAHRGDPLTFEFFRLN